MTAVPPSPLYKYRDDSVRTEEIITNGKVWLATADQLNDPLECKTGQIPEDWTRKRIREMEDAQVSGFLMSAVESLKGKQSLYSLSYREANQWFQSFKRTRNREDVYARVRSFLKYQGCEISRPAELFKKFEGQLSRIGVFSLTECPDNELMWAHYASSHTGLALGFERAPASKLASNEYTMQVVYNNVRPTFTRGFINHVTLLAAPGGGIRSEQKIGFNDPTFRAAFSTKPVAWKYEQEWRYVEETSGLFPWPGRIERVVFGLKMPNARREHYADLVSRAVPNSVEFLEVTKSADNASFVMIHWSGIP